MSKPRYDWWGYAKAIIRRYPTLRAELQERQRPAMEIDYSGMPHGGGAVRSTELIAIRELPTQKQREYEAVRKAIEATERVPGGRDRIKVIDLVFWRRSHTLEGAALTIPCSYRTAPVSYTHLDVYKRQALWCVAAAIIGVACVIYAMA